MLFLFFSNPDEWIPFFELLNYIVKGIYKKLWSSISTIGGILSWPSNIVRLSISRLLNTADAVMTTSNKCILSELSAHVRAGTLPIVSF